MCLIRGCQRRCKARDALRSDALPLFCQPSNVGEGRRVVGGGKAGSIEIKNPGEIVLCYVIGAIVPLSSSPLPPPPLPPGLIAFPTVSRQNRPRRALSFSFLSVSLSFVLTAFIRAFIVIQGTGSEHRCFISFDDTHLAIESPMRRAMGIISKRITVIFSSLSRYLFIMVCCCGGEYRFECRFPPFFPFAGREEEK